MHVLFLTPWYPNRSDAMDGIFVRKHAQAVAAMGVSVSVLRVHPDPAAKRIEVDASKVEGVNEVMVYTPESPAHPLRPATAALNFLVGFWRGYKAVERRGGRPDVIQVNVLTRMGVMAWAMRMVMGVPYVIIEHWGRYHPWRNEYKGAIRRFATETSCMAAERVMTVSEDLGQVMRQCGIKAKRWCVVRNVVNDFFFSGERTPRGAGPCRLLCVTTAAEWLKNTTGTLRGLKRVADRGLPFHLTIAGLERKTVKSVDEAVSELGLEDKVTFAGEVPPEEVSRLMHSSDALILFSNKENAPCVISEALASGTPVVATGVGGIPEMLDDLTGIIVPSQDEAALADAVCEVITGEKKFNKKAMRKAGEAYSFGNVGRQLVGIYKETIAK